MHYRGRHLLSHIHLRRSKLILFLFIVLFAAVGAGLKFYSHAASLTGDLNNDGVVNVFDLSLLLSHWQQTGTGVTGDLNNDSVVNIFDLSILLSNWGATSTGAVTPNYYVAQAATGTGDGSSCANAEPYTWFNTQTNWGVGKPIAPGTIVGLCGTITGAGGNNAVLTAQGSGTSGNPVTIYWEPGASVQEPACYSSGPNSGPGCFNVNGQSYLTLDGGQNGSILSTANGYNEPNSQQFTMGVWAGSGTSHDLTIKNLNISGMWTINGNLLGVPQNGTDCNNDTGQTNTGIQFGSGSNITIANDTLDWDRTAIVWTPIGSTQANVTVSGSTMSNDGTTINPVSNFNGGGNIGPFFFDGNTISNFAPWETGNTACVHDDGIHGWDSPGFVPPHWNGVYIYNNRWSGMGAGFAGDPTSYIFLESGTTGGGSTIFADNTSPIYVFNNVFSGVASNALVETTSGLPYIFNNTVIGTSTSSGGCIQPYTDGGNSGAATVKNNAVTSCSTLSYMYSASGTHTATPTWDYNVYSNGSSGNAWFWNTSDRDGFSVSGFSAWQSSGQVNGDAHSCATFGSGIGACAGGQTSLMLNADGSPQAGSPVLGAGTNLTSLCTGYLAPLCQGIDGAARPSTGAWNAGAY